MVRRSPALVGWPDERYGRPRAPSRRRCAGGVLPAAGGVVEFLPQPSARDAGVIAFTAHAVVFADVSGEAARLRALLPPGDLSAPLNPPFLAALCAATGRRVNNTDVLTAAGPPTGPPPPMGLRETTDRSHPRLVRALERPRRRPRVDRPRRDRPHRARCSRALGGGRRGRPRRPGPGAEPGPVRRRAAPGPPGSAALGADRARQRGRPARLPGRRVPPAGRGGPARAALTVAGRHAEACQGTGTAQGSMIHTVLPPSSVGVTWSRPPDSAMR